MAILGSVNVAGLDLSPAMRNDLASGMSASAFNSKYSASVPGFRPIALSRQVGPTSSPAPAAPAPAPAPAAPDPWQGEVTNRYNEIGEFDKNAKNPLDIYNAALDRLGISDARTRVTDLRQALLNTENLVRNVEGDVGQRTQEKLVTQAQKNRLVAQEQQPLIQAAQIQGRNLEMANADYQGILNEGKFQSDAEYKGQADKRAALMDRLKIAIDGAKTAEDKRRWEAEYARLKDKDAEERRRWEADHALRVQEANRAAANASRSAGAASSAKNASMAALKSVGDYLNSKKGSDGKVAPSTFAEARKMWSLAGMDAAAFNDTFAGWVNNSHRNDYI